MSERIYQLTLGHDRIGMLDQYYRLIETSDGRPPVRSKRDFYRRYARGEFGNSSPHWDSLPEYLNSGYEGQIAIRVSRPGGRCDYFIDRRDVPARVASFLRDYRDEELQFLAQCPEHDVLLRGEVTLTAGGLYLFGSTRPDLSMRQALRADDALHEQGLLAHARLKAALCGNSWEWLQYLLRAYPGHTIEFTALRYSWGTVPGFNTLFWEVRAY